MPHTSETSKKKTTIGSKVKVLVLFMESGSLRSAPLFLFCNDALASWLINVNTCERE